MAIKLESASYSESARSIARLGLLVVLVSGVKVTSAELNQHEKAGAGAEAEEGFSMPPRYPIVADDREFFMEPGVNKEFKVWHAPYPAPGSVWPLPTKVQCTQQLFLIDSEVFKFQLTKADNDLLRKAIDRYHTLIVVENKVSFLRSLPEPEAADRPFRKLRSVKLEVASDGRPYPHLKMNEAYTISINASTDDDSATAVITAHETWGALRALETFAQLVLQSPYQPPKPERPIAPQLPPTAVNSLLFVNNCRIDDAPRFPHRGVMIDTARHFISKDNLLRNLDAMAINKMNVFHWHIVDDSSFPFESRVWPLLSQRGAYDPVNMVYSHLDIRHIVEYARQRGIRVVPEFDVPGHTHAWGRGYPQVLTPCYTQEGGSGGDKWRFDGHFGPMNPAKNFTYHFLEKLFEEVLELFPDEYIHLGGDETPGKCWMTNPIVRAAFPNATERDILSTFLSRVQDVIEKIGQRRNRTVHTIMWHDIVDKNRQAHKAGSAVQVWVSYNPQAPESINLGYDVVYSACWYLDNPKPRIQWIDLYKCDPYFASAVALNSPKFLGGESAMWTEYQDDVTVLSRIWPLSCTTAERLWSSVGVDTVSAAPRLEEQRCRMASRGVPVGVASGSGACPGFGDKGMYGGIVYSDFHADFEVAVAEGPSRFTSVDYEFYSSEQLFFLGVMTIAVTSLFVFYISKRSRSLVATLRHVKFIESSNIIVSERESK